MIVVVMVVVDAFVVFVVAVVPVVLTIAGWLELAPNEILDEPHVRWLSSASLGFDRVNVLDER